jgi:hypothetical protein
MKALSIRQPWAWAIIHAGKDIENRSWPTRFRGRFLVHASKGMTPDEYEDCLDTMHNISISHPFPAGLVLPTFEALERGGIIGSVELVDCVEGTLFNSNPWFFGPYGFRLANPEPLPFHPVRGALGFFDPIDGPPVRKKPKTQISFLDEETW